MSTNTEYKSAGASNTGVVILYSHQMPCSRWCQNSARRIWLPELDVAKLNWSQLEAKVSNTASIKTQEKTITIASDNNRHRPRNWTTGGLIKNKWETLRLNPQRWI